MRKSPITIIGSESTCPMVRPGTMKPRNASGSRKHLADDPGDAVTDEEEPGDGARPAGQPPHVHSDRQDREQKDALEDRLVELARMARLRSAVREHHRPGNIAGPAVQLAVDEICDTAQKEADRHLRADRIGDGEQADFHNAGVKDHCNQHPKEPAVKGHAALPDHRNLARIGEEVARLIEQYVAKPAAHDHAEGAPHHQVVRVALGQPIDAFLGEIPNVLPADHEAEHVSQRVPAYGDGADLDGHRVDGGEGEGEGHR